MYNKFIKIFIIPNKIILFEVCAGELQEPAAARVPPAQVRLRDTHQLVLRDGSRGDRSKHAQATASRARVSIRNSTIQVPSPHSFFLSFFLPPLKLFV